VVGAWVRGASQRVPGAWGEPMAQELLVPRVPFLRALVPWVVGGSVSLLAFGLADRRALQLDLADAQVRLPPPRPAEPPWVQDRRSELDTLRDDVRQGSATLDSYLRARRALARALERAAQVESGEDGGVP